MSIADALAGLHERYERGYGAGDHIAGLVRRGDHARRHPEASSMPSARRLAIGCPARKGARMAGREAVQRALTRLLGHEAVRAQVVEALVRHGAASSTLLIEQLRAEDLETRQAAAVALGRIGDAARHRRWSRRCDDRELAVPAAGALARIGDRDAFERAARAARRAVIRRSVRRRLRR